jgi:hypothetical protein
LLPPPPPMAPAASIHNDGSIATGPGSSDTSKMGK